MGVRRARRGVAYDLRVERPDGPRIRADLAAFVDLLRDGVASGAGLGFMPPLANAEAESYWARVAGEVDAGTRIVISARVDGALAGSAQLDLCERPNGLHRAEVQKVMVRSTFRRRGIGRAIMRAVDDAARDHGRTSLFLDTFADQDARRLYEAAGWRHAGDIPEFALMADGTLGATSYYYRLLPRAP